MAHKGKYYPVNFRRDFNFQSDVRSTTALPDTWTVTLHSNVSPPYTIDGAVFICPPTTPFTVRHINWLSDWQSIGGFDWRLGASVEFSNLPGGELFGQWQLERRDKTLVNAWRNNLPSLFDPMGYYPLAAAVLFSDITVFPRGAEFYHSLFDPGRYPP